MLCGPRTQASAPSSPASTVGQVDWSARSGSSRASVTTRMAAPFPGAEDMTSALTAFSRMEKSAMPRPWTPQRSMRTLSSLAVTRASKTRACMSPGMPEPSSSIVTVRRSPSRLVAT